MPSNSQALWAYAVAIAPAGEEARRNKIGRGYYALAFHAALPSSALALTVKGAGGVHRQLATSLTNICTPDQALATRSRTIGTLLGLARDLRDLADYDLSADVAGSHVRKCMGFVERGLRS